MERCSHLTRARSRALLSLANTAHVDQTRPVDQPNAPRGARERARAEVMGELLASARERLQPLVAAGWSADGIVTLSQLVSFLAFQVRVVAGLTVLAAEGSR